MSDLLRKIIIEEKPLKNLRIDKNIILHKIQNTNLVNKNPKKNLTKKIPYYKKVSIKPLTARKKLCLTKFNNQKNFEEIIKNINSKKRNNQNSNKDLNYTNKDIFISYGNKEFYDYSGISMNLTNPEIDNNKILSNNNQNILINNENSINIEKNEKKINNHFFVKNMESKQNKKDEIKKQNKNNNKIKEIIIRKNNTDINNDLDLSFYNEKRENVNINYINSISNNVYGKINSPIFLNRIYSLYNNINGNYNLLNTMTEPTNNKSRLKISKNLKKKILLNENDLNLGINLTNNETDSNYNRFDNLTEKNNSKNEEMEMNMFKNHENKNEKMNFFENTKKIMSSIEKEKKKLIADNHKIYIKYNNLIQKQKKQYKEYEQYLKKELKNNRNSQIQLELFQESYFKNLKAKFRTQRIRILPEFKTLSLKNFAAQTSKNINAKNKIFLFNKLKNKIKINKKKIKIEKHEPALKKENSVYLIETSKNRNSARPFNKRVIQINEEELKKRNTTNILNKSNKTLNLMTNRIPINFDKNISNVSHLYINNKTIITPERSYNFQIHNCSSSDRRLIKNNKKIKLNIFSESKNIKTDKREFDKNKNILFLNNTKKSLILKKLVKNKKTETEKKSENNRNIINNKNYKRHVKFNSLKRISDINEYYLKPNISNNNFKNKNFLGKEIHKVITEEKKKIVNNSKDKKPNFKKLKKIIFFSGLKSK